MNYDDNFKWKYWSIEIFCMLHYRWIRFFLEIMQWNLELMSWSIELICWTLELMYWIYVRLNLSTEFRDLLPFPGCIAVGGIHCYFRDSLRNSLPLLEFIHDTESNFPLPRRSHDWRSVVRFWADGTFGLNV